MLEHVTYGFYSDVMGCAVIPDENTFNRHKTAACAFVRSKLPFIAVCEEKGLDKAACMVAEVLYETARDKTADGRIETSRSIEGFSQSFDVSKVQTLYDKKMERLRLFCTVSTGLV